MSDQAIPTPETDKDGLLTYEYIANNIEDLDDTALQGLVDTMLQVDTTGQFLSSAARYLHAIDATQYREAVRRLVARVIDVDREHRFLPDLLPALWGKDYAIRAEALSADDDNFRRIYKRVFPTKF